MTIAAANHSRQVLYGGSLDSDPTSYAQFVGITDDGADLRIWFNTATSATAYQQRVLKSSNGGDAWALERTLGLGASWGHEVGRRPQAHIQLPDGTMLRRSNGEDFSPSPAGTAYLERSTDAGATWAPAGADYIGLGLGSTTTVQWARMYRLANGALIAPGQDFQQPAGARQGIAFTKPMLRVSPGGTGSGDWTNALVLPSNWGQPGDPANLNLASRLMPNEWSVVELADGDLLAMFRTGDRPWNGTSTAISYRFIVHRLDKTATNQWTWGVHPFLAGPWAYDTAASGSATPTFPELLRVAVGSKDVVLFAARKDQTSPLSFYYSEDEGVSWQSFALGSYVPTTKEPYYARMSARVSGGVPTIHLAGHSGADNHYGDGEESIVYHRFTLAEVGAGSPPAAPSFSVPSGSYNATQSVALSAEGGASIRYTTNGSTPTSASTLYTGAISVAATTTLKAVAISSSGSSPVATAVYVIDTVAPVAPEVTPAGGSSVGAVSVTMAGEAAATLRFTLDGSTPTASVGTVYVGPVQITRTTTLKAVAVDVAGNVSPVNTVTFTITGSGATTGSFGAAAATGAGQDGVGASSWDTPANVLAADASVAATTLGTPNASVPDVSNGLYTTGHGIALDSQGVTIPDAAVIDTLQIGVQRVRVGNQQVKDHALCARKADGSLTPNIAADPSVEPTWPSAEAERAYTLTNPGLTGADIKAANFGAYIQARNAGTDTVARVNRMRILGGTFTVPTASASLADLIAAAPAFGTLEVPSGSYPVLTLTNVMKTNLVVKPAPGATVTIAGSTQDNVKGITFQGFTWTGKDTIDRCADLLWKSCEFVGYDGVQFAVDLNFRNSDRINWEDCTFRDATWVPPSPTTENGPSVLSFTRAPRSIGIRRCIFRDLQGFDAVHISGWAGQGRLLGDFDIEDNQFIRVTRGDTAAHADGIQITNWTDGIRVRRNRFSGGSRGCLIQPSGTTLEGEHLNFVFEDNEKSDSSDFLLSVYNAPGAIIRRNRDPTYSATSDNTGIRINYSWLGAQGQPTTGVTLTDNVVGKLSQFDGAAPGEVVSYLELHDNTYTVAGGSFEQPAPPAAPAASPVPGTYPTTQNVALAVAPGTVVHFTLDGTTPTAASPVYSGPIAVAATTTITAVAISSLGATSPVSSGAWVISATPPPPPDPEEPQEPTPEVPADVLAAPDPKGNLMAERAVSLVRETGAHTQGEDAESDALLEGLVRGSMAGALRISIAAHGDGEGLLPWEAFTNPQKAPLWGLPFAAQFIGGRPPRRRGAETDAEYLVRARVELGRARNMRRGSAASLLDIASGFLSGDYPYRLVERAGGNRWRHILVVDPLDIVGSSPAGTVDRDALEDALNDPAVVPAGARVDVVLLTEATWDNSALPWDGVAPEITWDNVLARDILWPSGLSRYVAEVLFTSDAATRVLGRAQLAEALAITDAAALLTGPNRTASDSVALRDVLARVAGRARTASDSLGVADAVARTSRKVRVPSETLAIGDSVTVLGGRAGLTPNAATLEASLAAWEPANAGSTVTRVVNAAAAHGGSAYLRISRADTTSLHQAQLVAAERLTVVPGQQVSGSCFASSESASGRTVSLGLQWWNSAGGLISTTWGTEPNVVQGAYSPVTVSGVAPTGAVKVGLVFGIALSQPTTSSAVIADDFALSPSATLVLADAFERTVAAGGWGTADVGGAWTPTGTLTDYSVNGSRGVMSVAANATRAVKSSASRLEWDYTDMVVLPTLPVGGNVQLLAYFREVVGTRNYRFNTTVTPTGAVNVGLVKFATPTTTPIHADMNSAITSLAPYTAGAGLMRRFQVVGTNPTVLRVKVWLAGQPEPAAWLFESEDSEATLQTAGVAGPGAFVAGAVSNGPVVVHVDNIAAPEPTLAPPPPVARFWGARITHGVYNSLYGTTSLSDAPWAASDPAPNHWDLFEQHVTSNAGTTIVKRVAFVQYGLGVRNGTWWDTGNFFQTGPEDLSRARGAFTQLDWGIRGAPLADILANNATAQAKLGGFFGAMKAKANPILFRPFWEFNGNWFAWGRAQASTSHGDAPQWGSTLAQRQANYVAAWRFMWQICADVMRPGGVAGDGLGTNTGNVSFFWCPNIFEAAGTTPNPTPWFPGAAYCDWIGFDGYATSSVTYVSPSALFDETYNALALLPGNLPIAIGEFGVAQNTPAPFKEGWIEEFFDDWLPLHPRLKAFNYFNDQGTNNSGDPLEMGRAAAPNAPRQMWASKIVDPNIIGSPAAAFAGGQKVPVPA